MSEVDLTMRQASLAYLKRLPRSEWGNFWLLYKTLFVEDDCWVTLLRLRRTHRT